MTIHELLDRVQGDDYGHYGLVLGERVSKVVAYAEAVIEANEWHRPDSRCPGCSRHILDLLGGS